MNCLGCLVTKTYDKGLFWKKNSYLPCSRNPDFKFCIDTVIEESTLQVWSPKTHCIWRSDDSDLQPLSSRACHSGNSEAHASILIPGLSLYVYSTWYMLLFSDTKCNCKTRVSASGIIFVYESLYFIKFLNEITSKVSRIWLTSTTCRVAKKNFYGNMIL